MNQYTLFGTSPLNLPDVYLKMNTMPEDPEYSAAYGFESENAQNFFMVFPVPGDRSMPYSKPQAVIDGIHHALADDQGIIEVDSGETKQGRQFIYSIIKTVQLPQGVQYCLTMDIDFQRYALHLQGFFDENGVTGIRDATIYTVMRQQNKSSEEVIIRGWNRDPYDPGYKKGSLMNISEEKRFDAAFPHHPLSEARALVSFIILNN